MAHAVDFLVRLMALAGNQHHVLAAGHADGFRDGGGPITPHDGARCIGKASQDVSDDHIAIFATRVVVGDECNVRAAFCNRRHLRALAGVALTATAEHADQLAGGVRA